MEKGNQQLSIRRQCEMLSFNRSSLYYERIGLSEEDQRILDEMDLSGFPYLWEQEDEQGVEASGI